MLLLVSHSIREANANFPFTENEVERINARVQIGFTFINSIIRPQGSTITCDWGVQTSSVGEPCRQLKLLECRTHDDGQTRLYYIMTNSTQSCCKWHGELLGNNS